MNRVIGVVLSLIHAEISKEFLSSLHKATMLSGDKLLVFNSITDFKYDNGEGAKTPYRRLPLDKIDALIILNDTIRDTQLFDEIVELAHKKYVPTIFARREVQGEYFVTGKYENAFKNLIRHVVKNCCAKNVVYISGRRDIFEGKPSDSLNRYIFLKDELNDFGLEMDESHVIFGDYQEKPTIDAVNEWLEEGKPLPDAFICANDIMAAAVCKVVKALGYKIPEDVVVTGFDGMECARYSKPKLTTCKADLSEMSALIIKLIDEIFAGNTVERGYYYGYTPIISESTGLDYLSNGSLDADSSEAYNYILKNEEDEIIANRWLDYLDYNGPSFELFSQSVGSYIGSNQVMFLRHDVDTVISNLENGLTVTIPEEFTIYDNDSVTGLHKTIKIENVFDAVSERLSVDEICVMTGVYIRNVLIGYHCETISDVYAEGRTLNRHVLTTIRAIQSCLNVVKTTMLISDIEKSKYTDALTGVDNMRGFQFWFDNFNKDKENHDKYFEFCMFTFINHDTVLREYETEEYDRCLLFIINALKEAHPEGTYIARISAAGFVVIISAKDAHERHQLVYETSHKFYKMVASYNGENEGNFQIEVSSGSVAMNPQWDGSMTSYINDAYTEIYKNRAALYKDERERKHVDMFAELDSLDKLSIIIKENRLTYFFQPIVSAVTGEIVAFEALMRITGDIPSNPMELLSIARKHRRLYDIERATFFNVFETYKQRKEEFGNRIVFINTIPGNFLYEEDTKLLSDMYGDMSDNIVVEITEDNTVEQEELDKIRRFGGSDDKVRIAIDDYGTGHSNIINLITYKPDIVKIDRFLITDIHVDDNKRMLVKSVIEFAKSNNIKTLAEGVETNEEMLEVISLGIDYIQGYYTAKPSGEIISEINPDIKNAIVSAPR